MDLEAINQSLKRHVNTSGIYNKHFKDVSCKSTYLGSSDTDFTLRAMRDWTIKHLDQAKSISEALLGATKKQSIDNTHVFLYDFFQYEIDGAEQMLKSPNCAWKTRFSGHDCKTFSMLASAILSNMGIAHSFRKIKQISISPEYWTHVYVVIPKFENADMRNKSDYWVLDATINPNIEVPYLAKKDLKMSVKLKHYGMNAAVAPCECKGKNNASFTAPKLKGEPNTNFYNESELQKKVEAFNSLLNKLESNGIPAHVTDYALKNLQTIMSNGLDVNVNDIFGKHINLIKSTLSSPTGLNAASDNEDDGGFNWEAVTDFVGGLFGGKCWGGTAYDANVLDADVNISNGLMQSITSKINQAIESQNLNALSAAVAEFKGAAKFMVLAYYGKLLERNWNSCSRVNLNIILDMAKVYQNKAIPALDAYINNFFNNTGNGQSYVFGTYNLGLEQTFAVHSTPEPKQTIRAVKYAFKGVPVPKFEINSFLFDNPTVNTSNANGFLDTLTDIVVSNFGGNGNQSGTNGNTNGNQNNTGAVVDQNNGYGNNGVQQAGFSGIIPLVIGSGLIIGAVKMYNDKKKTKNAK